MVGKYKKTCDYVILFWKWKRLMQNIVPHRNLLMPTLLKKAPNVTAAQDQVRSLDHQLLNTWRLET